MENTGLKSFLRHKKERMDLSRNFDFFCLFELALVSESARGTYRGLFILQFDMNSSKRQGCRNSWTLDLAEP